MLEVNKVLVARKLELFPIKLTPGLAGRDRKQKSQTIQWFHSRHTVKFRRTYKIPWIHHRQEGRYIVLMMLFIILLLD